MTLVRNETPYIAVRVDSVKGLEKCDSPFREASKGHAQ